MLVNWQGFTDIEIQLKDLIHRLKKTIGLKTESTKNGLYENIRQHRRHEWQLTTNYLYSDLSGNYKASFLAHFTITYLVIKKITIEI